MARDAQQQDGARDRRRRADPIHHPHYRRDFFSCLLAFWRLYSVRGREWDRLSDVVIYKLVDGMG
jgi:hypothetical protein